MSISQVIVLYVTCTISVIAVVVSWFSFRLNKKNRDTGIREKLYEKQFEFYIKINQFTGLLGQIIESLNQVYTDKKNVQEGYYKLLEELDLFIDQNEILLSNNMHKEICAYSSFLNQVSKRLFDDFEGFSKEDQQDYLNKMIDFLEGVREELNFEELIYENKKLFTSRRYYPNMMK